ncbi:MAG: PD-(D/E)XK nuclease family protein [Candidatus Latescibacterota bacterium]
MRMEIQTYHLEQLGALCARHATAPKVVLLPSLQAGHSTGVALAQSGCGWLNLHLLTPEEWAARLVLPELEAEGWRTLPSDHDLLFVEDLITQVPEGHGEGGWLPGPELARPLLRTLQELRLAGAQPADLPPAGGGVGDGGFLAQAYRDYVALLQERRYADAAGLFARALARRSSGTGRHQGAGTRPDLTVYAVFDEVLLGELAFRLLCQHARDRLYRIGREDYGVPPPRHSAAARLAAVPIPSKALTCAIHPAGRSYSVPLAAEHGDRVRLVQTLGAEGEAAFVARDVLERGCPLDTVEVAYTAGEPYLYLLHALSERLDLPMTFASGVPPQVTRPGQALSGFLRWVASGFDARELVGLCQARLLAWPRGAAPPVSVPAAAGGASQAQAPGVGVTASRRRPALRPAELATLLRRARIRQGHGAYGTGFSRLTRELGLRLAEAERGERPVEALQAQFALVEAARRVVDGLFALLGSGEATGAVPAAGPPPTTTLARLTQACQAFLARHAPGHAGYDEAARSALTEYLRTLGESIDYEGPLPRLARYLHGLLERHTVEARGAQPGRIHVVPVERAGYTQRPHLYVLGLDEGSFPGRGAEDPLLPDAVRRRLGLPLGLHQGRATDRVWQLVRAVGMAPGRVTLVSRRRSLADGTECYPCAFFQHLADQLGVPVDEAPIEPLVPTAVRRCLTETEGMLASRACLGYGAAVGRAFPHLVQGRLATQQQERPGVSRFHGWLGRPTPELDPATGAEPVSASRLECLTQCPYRYFLQHVLRLQPAEEAEEDPARWLHPLDFGRLLHGLLCEFMSGLQRAGQRPDRQRHGPRLDELVRTRLQEWTEQVPIVHQAAYRADAERLAQAAHVFLAAESGRPEVEPFGFEVSFGLGRSDGLSCPEPVLLELDPKVRLLLRGLIDRVDRHLLTGPEYSLWDYKTGSPSRYAEETLVSGGEHLQWVLYAYALQEILHRRGLEGRVARSGYFFTSDRGYGRRVAPPLPPPEALAARLEPILGLVRQGCFLHLQRTPQCRHCDFGAACDQHPLGAGDLEALEAAAEAGSCPEAVATDLPQLIRTWLDG